MVSNLDVRRNIELLEKRKELERDKYRWRRVSEEHADITQYIIFVALYTITLLFNRVDPSAIYCNLMLKPLLEAKLGFAASAFGNEGHVALTGPRLHNSHGLYSYGM